ncbi:MAG: peptide chain release factor N(5)-glutamine methyltransferase [Alphaproteobacteria bacterium]|nr:peptide chain release factor N(5)-glutamine methyltransferase [Alphaproteobacteria bacterium]
MKTNQAFTVLSRAGGIRAARIITDEFGTMYWWRVWRIARALRRGVPVAKIIHKKWFYAMPFYTNMYTLDPRPDTETIVASVIADCAPNTLPRILDLGTGTGCIIAAIVKNVSGATGVGMEKSYMARRVARRNIRTLGMNDKISIVAGDFTRTTQKNDIMNHKFDIIVSNPPYIAPGDTRVNAGARHDPYMALYAGECGRAAYCAIAKNARNWIDVHGKIYVEIGEGMYDDVRNIFVRAGWTFIRADADLSGILRVLVFCYN